MEDRKGTGDGLDELDKLLDEFDDWDDDEQDEFFEDDFPDSQPQSPAAAGNSGIPYYDDYSEVETTRSSNSHPASGRQAELRSNQAAYDLLDPGANVHKGAATRNNDQSNDSKNRTKEIIIIILGVVIIILIILLRCCDCGGSSSGSKIDLAGWLDDNAVTGSLPGKTEEELQEDLNRVVEDGMFNISIASAILFEKGSDQGLARIENIPANKYFMTVAITLDDTGELLYESKGLKPGQYIESITLNRAFDRGSYPATALFTAYDPETLEVQGNVAVKVTLYFE